MERASAADFAFHPDLAAHEFDQADADGQSQPSAPVFPSGGTIGLRKWLENEPELFRRNAAARIGHAKMQHDPFLDLRFQLHPHTYETSAGELDGVTEEIEQDLADAQRVTQQRV